MAKRTATRRAPRVSTGKGNDSVVVVNASPPARRSSPRRASSAPKRRRSRAGSAVKRYEKSGLKTRMTSMAVGGFALGFIENWMMTSPTGMKIPTIPMLGRKGTIAAAIYFLEPKTKILQDAGVAAAAIAGHELGSTGTITGDFQTSGVDTPDDYAFSDFEEDDDDDDDEN